MASKISKTASSSSISKDEYDVFMSFNWEDIGKSFADHLYTALVEKGLHPFREAIGKPDNKEAIASESLMAIEKSKLFIVIFSKNYAQSGYNLDELVKIIKSRQSTGKLVVPVYYHVDPSDVWRQQGYGDQHGAKQEKEKIDNWRAALTEASFLSGFYLNDPPVFPDKRRKDFNFPSVFPGFYLDKRYESTIIMEITDSVIDKLKHEYFGDDYLVGINSRLEELKSLLGIGFDDVRFLGVYGIGGMGKTTIGEVIYNLFSYRFNGVSFLPKVSGKSMLQLQKTLLLDITGEKDKYLDNIYEGIKEKFMLPLQKPLLIDFTGKKPKVLDNVNEEIEEKSMLQLQNPLPIDFTGEKAKKLDNVDEGINEIKMRLGQKKVLIILDDVDHLSQLKCLVGDHGWFGRGSRIIITTRDKHLLVEHGVDATYEVEGLDFEESIHLFSLCAFKQRFPWKGYEKLSRYIVDYAKGHPFTLKLLGYFLSDKKISEWEKALDQLKYQPMKEIQNVLQISYDRLDCTTKNIFLDIVCFFKGEEREFVSRILDGAEQAISALYNMSLLTFSNNKILMHPLLQQMGQVLVRQACVTEPGKWSRLWNSEDVHHVLTENKGTNAIEGIFLNMSTSKPIEFTTEAFKMMNRLRLLKVHRDLKCGSIVKTCVVHVSTGFEFPSYELRYLHWDEYPLESLPLNFDGVNLIELNLQYSKLRGLWTGKKILEKLKVINLSHSQQLIQIPDFSDTPNLESLILEGCTNLEKLPSSIWELDSLVNLDLSHCSKLQKLSEIQWNLYSLEYLNLAFCKKLESLPQSLCNLKCLKTLNVIGCSKLGRLPKSLGSLECLEKLCASDASLISPQLHSSLSGLCSLKKLDVHGTCLMQGAISSDIGSLYSLEELDLSYCNLKKGGIPDDICCLYSLRVLDLNGNHFVRVTDAISQLSKLRVLGLRHCTSLLEIPKLPSSLRVLDAYHCISMENLSSTSLLLWQEQLNCFKSGVLQEIQELKYRRLLSLPETGTGQGFSTVIPASGEVPEWISQKSNGSEVTVELPLNWYDNKVLLGFALCCVYIPQQDEPESSTSEDAMVDITQPYRLGCELTFLDDEIGFLDSLFCGSSCQCHHNDGVSYSVWVTYYSNVAIKHKYRSDKSRHLKASFRGYVDGKPVKVEKCGIGLVHDDFKKIHGGAGYSELGSGKI